MAKETLQSVEQMVDTSPQVDTTEFFDRLWVMLGGLRARLDQRFDLQRDPCSDAVASYGEPDGPHGEMELLSGPEVDWLVHSRVGNPQYGFTNMHLTTWLGPQTTVPHLGFAFGTLPNFFILVEYVPRSDLAVDVAALDRYYEPVNEKWLAVREHPKLAPFVSRSLYVRQVMSETSFCYSTERTQEMIDYVEQLAHAELDRWLAWVDEADPTPPDQREALAARDLAIRRTTAERDPANVLAQRYFGDEFTQTLVRGLWGGDRETPRAG